MIGKRLNHYRILESLGKGGMGEVFLAEDTRLERKVALKILPAGMAEDADRLARFTREAKAIAALNHPNIITIHAVEEAEGIHFLAMELVEGRTLDHMILKDGMPVSRILEIAVPLADALAAAHDKGITHRDLKPGNVMVTETGRVKLLDFGLARTPERSAEAQDTQLPTEQVTRDGVVMGTLPYMSPEQAEGKPVDHRSDIFSLGIILHEMASGSRPFRGDTVPGLMSSILKDRPPSLADLRKELPADLVRVAARCLAKDPLERFQTARDVFNELRLLQRQIDSGQAVLTSSSPALGAALPRTAHSRLPVILGVAAAAVVLAAGAWWMLSGREGGAVEPGPPGAGAPAMPGATEPERTMMVVLPFENMGAAEDDYFADGVAEEIMSRLSAVKELGVISRKSAMSYAGTDKTIQEIGEELGVVYVLEGTIRWARAEAGTSRVRITPQLIRVSDDTQVWSETYDRVIDDIFEVQGEIATKVTEQMGVTLLDSDRASLSQRPTRDLQAYQDYLRGLDYESNYDRDSLERAVDLFDRARQKDPGFVEAHAMAARAHAGIMHFGYDQSEERDRLARSAAERALELAPDSPEPWVAMGYYHYHGHKRYAAALEAFQRAADLRPGDAEILMGMALVQRRQGRWEESTANLEKAVRMDPRNNGALVDLGDNLVETGRYAEAVDWLKRAEEIRPDHQWSYFYQVFAHWLWKADLKAARRILETMPPGDPATTDYMWADQLLRERDYQGVVDRMAASMRTWPAMGSTGRLPAIFAAWGHRFMGHDEEARRLFDEARRELEPLVASGTNQGDRMRSALAIAYAGLGMKEEALREARRSVEQFSLEADAVWSDYNLADLALVQVMVGDLDGAFGTLDRLMAVPQSVVSVPLLQVDPRWDPLKEHPTYTAFLSRHTGGSAP